MEQVAPGWHEATQVAWRQTIRQELPAWQSRVHVAWSQLTSQEQPGGHTQPAPEQLSTQH
jgi:hypothetical protein